MLRRTPLPVLLIIGDLVCVLLATVAGFAFHRETSAAAGARFIATFLPFAAAWSFASLLAGAYAGGSAQRWQRTGRSVGAAVLAAPLGAILRGAWLGTPALPVFAAVMGSVVAALILLWRLAAERLMGRRRDE